METVAQRKDKPSAFAVAYRRWMAVLIAMLFIAGLVLVYTGLGVGRHKCLGRYRYQTKYYHWDCHSYYAGDSAVIALETVLVAFVPLAVYLKLKKPLQFPLMAFLIIMTVFMIMSMKKYANEQPERGLFLQPHSDDEYYYSYDPASYEGRTYDLSISKENSHSHNSEDGDDDGYDDDGYDDDDDGENDNEKTEDSYVIKGVKSFNVVELKGVYTHNGPRIVALVGYCLTVAGNVLLMLYIGIGECPSFSFPTSSKFEKTINRFRSQLAALIAPSFEALSDDEDEQKNINIQTGTPV